MQSLLVDDGAEYTVDRILDRREVGGQFEYKVDWGPQWSTALRVTWEPAECVKNAPEKVQEFLDRQVGDCGTTAKPQKRARKKR
jgi:hypothetical protein